MKNITRLRSIGVGRLRFVVLVFLDLLDGFLGRGSNAAGGILGEETIERAESILGRISKLSEGECQLVPDIVIRVLERLDEGQNRLGILGADLAQGIGGC